MGRIVPDYAPPAALMVPFVSGPFREVLSHIAMTASRFCGVILLSNDPAAATDFAASQPAADHFSVVGADLDTPWIRDRSPIAIRDRGEIRWVMPRQPSDDRPRDTALFATLSARPFKPAPLYIARGNLVAGPTGLALSTRRVLAENEANSTGELSRHGAALGIRRWVVFPSLPEEITGHADLYARFLRPNLLALPTAPDDRAVSLLSSLLEGLVRSALRRVQVVHLPVRYEGDQFASPLNWIQLGQELLVPSYPITPPEDRATIRDVLAGHGFRTHFIASPTLEHGGSLHCLSASVYL